MRRALIALAWAHTVVVLVHGAAHLGLGVLAPPLDSVFIALDIYLAPVVAALWLARGRERAGTALLAASLLGSFAYGAWHHFAVVSIDHVCHLPSPGSAWQPVFQATAGLAALTDLTGLALAAFALTARRS